MTDRQSSVISAFAPTAVLERIDPLLREIPGVIAGSDPEYLHRMRVASRRLRMALRILKDDAGLSDAGGFFRLVRSVTRTLGEARDLDVQIGWLEEFAARCGAKERGGVKRIALRLGRRREKVQPRIIRAIEKIPDSPVFLETVKELRRVRLEAEMSGLVTSPGDYEHATREIVLQTENVIQHSSSLLSPDSVEAQHNMRIEVKHLRYIMEIFKDLYGEGLDDYISVAKKLQGLLGDLHDADVWVAVTPDFAARERERTISYYGSAAQFARLSPGYSAIIADRAEFRQEQYKVIVKYWNETLDDDVWQKLRAFLVDEYREKQ